MMVTEGGGAKLFYPSSLNQFRFKPESTTSLKRPLVDKLHQSRLNSFTHESYPKFPKRMGDFLFFCGNYYLLQLPATFISANH